ncbi:phage infection protein [Pseudoxanthomonas sp. X-1]|nr:phage infection protein [Pseudoxanthomonas sp. X-1]TMN16196.1 phage infection protein [Pseudoxanthomonas sp. X-1]
MEQLSVDLENCYGIKKLQATFDFSETRAVAIYAPNGAMKSSLAETFKDIATNSMTIDRIFPERVTKREVTDELGVDITSSALVVLKSYEEVVPSERTSLLLVNSDLRLEYEKLLQEVQQSTESLITTLKRLSGSKAIEREVSNAFTRSDNQFLKALARIKDEVANQEGAPFAEIEYSKIFDQRTLTLLATKDFKQAIEAYVKSYNTLIDKSKYFKRGVFNYYNASTIAKNLADNGFFNAKHTIRLNGDAAVIEINDVKQLEEIIQSERNAISGDPDLQKKYAEIEKSFNKNQDLRDLQEYLSAHENVLPHLANIDEFREEVIKSYLKKCFDQVEALLNLVNKTNERKEQIEEAASKERTHWQDVIATFNDRFTVPFRLEVKNLVLAILGKEAPTLGFTFVDGDEEAVVEEMQLMSALSTGEAKAFYILNVMFDMNARMKSGEEALFIIDDIADSFDYKNKYAIIEYLRDAAEHSHFRQIVLTHNFDFFRTACSRYIGRKNCFMAVKSKEGLSLEAPYGVRTNVFEHWKKHFYDNKVIKIATIPFVRNIAEYTQGTGSDAYKILTRMLHVKPETTDLTVGDLDQQFNLVLNNKGAHSEPNKNFIEFVFEVADHCLTLPEGVNFENKIVLSIAIRLAAEKIMIGKLNDAALVEEVTKSGNQTARLSDAIRDKYPEDYELHKLLRQVILITPESIHLNSFMYEPIVDMSDERLRRLYKNVRALK